jgi:hypothetical protein
MLQNTDTLCCIVFVTVDCVLLLLEKIYQLNINVDHDTCMNWLWKQDSRNYEKPNNHIFPFKFWYIFDFCLLRIKGLNTVCCAFYDCLLCYADKYLIIKFMQATKFLIQQAVAGTEAIWVLLPTVCSVF